MSKRRPGATAPAAPGMRRQFAVLTAGRSLAAVVSAAWLVVAARLLGATVFGDLALLLALGAVISVVADFGLPIVLMESVARDPTSARQVVRVVVRKRVVLGCAAALTTSLLYVLSADNSSLAVPGVYAASILGTAVYSSATAALRATGHVEVEAVNEVLSRLAVLVGGIVWLESGGGLIAAASMYALVDVASAIAVMLLADRRFEHCASVFDRSVFALRRSAPLGVAAVVGTIYYRVDVWLLAVLADARDVGLYAASYRLLDGVLLPAGALAALVVTHTAPLEGQEKVKTVRRFVATGLAVVVPLAAVGVGFAEPILRRTFGPAFSGASGTLAVLMLSALPGAIAFVLAPVAATTDRARFARLVTVALVLNVGLNLVFIPEFGVVGAAWATLASQCALVALLCRGAAATPSVDDA